MTPTGWSEDQVRYVRSGEHDGCPWAEYTIPADRWSPVTGAKRTVRMSTEQRAAAAQRLAAASKPEDRT
jgi:hypothetical protein